MTRPGVDIISRDQPVPRSAPTQTGVWFAVGVTSKQSVTDPTPITSLTQYESVYGVRTGAIAMYDAIDAFFHEGGSRVIVQSAPTAGDSDITDALAKLDTKLGPGQVSAPGVTDALGHEAILDHVLATNRVALLEAPLGDEAALLAAATPLRTHEAAKFAAMFAPQAEIPGIASSTTRTVGFASLEAGIIARNDVAYSPNVPSAGTLGLSVYALDLSDRYTDTEYEELNDGGVDMARIVYGGIEAYGYRTLVDADAMPLWWNFGHARLHMAIVAQAGVIAERYVFKQLDGRGLTIASFGGELAAMLVPFYEQGSLYGTTADEAFSVNVGAQVNTPETIADGELHAIIEVKMSPFAERVVIEIVKVATTEALAV